MKERTYSTVEVARLLGIAQPNLQRLVSEKRIDAPGLMRLGGISIRLWTKKEIAAVRRYLKRHRRKL